MSVRTSALNGDSGSDLQLLEVLDGKLAALAAVFADDPESGLGAPGVSQPADSDEDDDSIQPASTVVAATQQLLSEVGDLDEVFEQIDQRLAALAEFCSDNTRSWTDVHQESLKTATEALDVLSVQTVNTVAAIDEIKSLLARQEAEVAHIVARLVTEFGSHVQRVENDFLHSVQTTARDFADSFERDCHSPLRTAYESTRSSIEQGLNATRDATLGEVRQLSLEVTSIQDAFLQATQNVVQQSAQSAVRSLIDAAADRLAGTVAESVLMTQLGAQLSSAMAPILPQMIALNKCAEALREAIRLWKELQRMGSLGL